MSEELQQKLRSQLWTVANTLRGNMSASDFMYFTLGFIFYKYLYRKNRTLCQRNIRRRSYYFQRSMEWQG